MVAAFEDLTSTRLESGSQHDKGEDYEDRWNHINHNLRTDVLHGNLAICSYSSYLGFGPGIIIERCSNGTTGTYETARRCESPDD